MYKATIEAEGLEDTAKDLTRLRAAARFFLEGRTNGKVKIVVNNELRFVFIKTANHTRLHDHREALELDYSF